MFTNLFFLSFLSVLPCRMSLHFPFFRKKRSVNAFTVEENILDTFSILPRPSPEHRSPQAHRLLCFGFLLIFCNFAAQRRALFLFARHH
ncbi:hypothetical protein [Prevotellamassilia timonensis]|uniref:hypothetical protein n=1 Tax=Prevotellamassilia timonensis TaxID=1852370 RepID=UPI001F27BCA8|nr:hypothetical protein [Prevotellamassilia timonensis]MCF2633857.1 hypothetical protein [Prevotellamassilia timonensis]